MATLALKDSYRTEVWRVMRAAIEADRTYEDAGIALQFFDGDPGIVADLDAAQCPVLRFLPTAGGVQYHDEGSINAALTVNVEARLTVLDCEDIFNLQEAIEDTLNTLDNAPVLQRDLIDAGAVTGLIVFNRPLALAPGVPGADRLFRLTGQFTIEVRRPLIP
jgi:hypothetical protein